MEASAPRLDKRPAQPFAMTGRKHTPGKHDRLTIKLCDELIEMARAAGDRESERLARDLKRAVRGGDERAIALMREKFEEHARQLTGR